MHLLSYWRVFSLLLLWMIAPSVGRVGQDVGQNWAVLVAGSKGYSNYRHQADLCHAYQLLRSRGGIPESNIIMMMYDDVAHDPQNPRPGTLFNKPSYFKEGRDVYQGCKVDYREDMVTPESFMNVLIGNSSTTLPKVLRSTEHDRVFMTFIDHGAPGILGFPNSSLPAMDLIRTMEQMVYKELLFYVEACESASMFENLLPPQLEENTYIVTASNSNESSYAWHCPPFDMVGLHFIGTCMADLFSINWIEDTERHNMTSETLWRQFRRVRFETLKSHVTEFGDEQFAKKTTVSEFLSSDGEGIDDEADVDVEKEQTYDSMQPDNFADPLLSAQGVNARDVVLVQRFYSYLRSTDQTPRQKSENAKALLQEVMHRQQVDDTIHNLATELMGDRDHAILQQPLGLRNFACHKDVNAAFETSCWAHTDYSLKAVRTLVNLCEILIDTNLIVNAVNKVCFNANERRPADSTAAIDHIHVLIK